MIKNNSKREIIIIKFSMSIIKNNNFYLLRNGENGFTKIIARSIAIHKNHASEAISKNSRIEAGALQARSSSWVFVVRSNYWISKKRNYNKIKINKGMFKIKEIKKYWPLNSQINFPHNCKSTIGPKINLKAIPISHIVR